MMDKIIIKDLECFGRHGVFKEENILGQKFVVSAEMLVNVNNTDDISGSVNYADVSKFISGFVSENMFKLIETLADKLACEILRNYNVKEVKIRVEKPFAPVGLPLDTVAVEVTRRWSRIYLSIGSNVGDRDKYLDMAVAELKSNRDIKVYKVSDYIRTEPYGYTNQDEFLNAAVEADTIIPPEELIDLVLSIEQKAHRVRDIHWGPRTLDIDLLLYEDFVSFTEKITVPHIDMHNRDFVLKPLCQIAPYAIHNVFNKSVMEMYLELKKEL